AGKPVALAQRRRIGAEPEPGAVAERHEAGVADQDIEPHARDSEHDDVDRSAQLQADEIERKWQQRQGERGDEQWHVIPAHRAHSNFKMRSPRSPRGRNSSTSAISRYIEAS